MLKPENTEEQKPSRRDVARYDLFDIVRSLTTVEWEDDMTHKELHKRYNGWLASIKKNDD